MFDNVLTLAQQTERRKDPKPFFSLNKCKILLLLLRVVAHR